MKTLRCRTVMKGVAEGIALTTSQSLCLYDSLDPRSGLIINRRHELYGQNISGRVFVFPHGTGSSTTAAAILEASRCHKAPRAMINVETDPVIAVGAVLAEKLYGTVIPVVNMPRKKFELIDTGDWVKVNADEGIIELTKTQSSSRNKRR